VELDDLKPLWAALDKSLVIQERLLRETLLRKVRFAQVPYVLGRVLEIAFCVALLLAFAPVIARHVSELRYLLIGVPMVALTLAITAVGCHSLSLVGLDYGGPVAQLQARVARLKRLEYQAFAWALFGGTVFWLPAFLIVFEAVTGYPALANVDLAWLIGNLAVGLALLACGLVLAKRFATNSRVVDAVTGRSLRRVEQYLDELAQFQRD
jgi:hypothetical protein